VPLALGAVGDGLTLDDVDRPAVEVSGVRIAYRQAGTGPPLVLLHGGMEDSRAWTRQFESLAEHFTLLAWDAPGCGQSSDVPETWRLADFADALSALLHELNVGHPHVLGLSWGSSVALEFYRRYSATPASLILASAYAGWAGSLTPEEVAARHASVLAAADLPREELLKGWPGVLSTAATPELIEEVMSLAADNSGLAHPGGYRAMAHSMAEADLRDVLPEIRVPTLLLYGELDERSPLQVAEDLCAQIPGAELGVIPGAGHLANMEAPAAFNAHVQRFIGAVTSS
jgi:pimeloyl-ACP methyl ester carboxylesterase